MQEERSGDVEGERLFLFCPTEVVSVTGSPAKEMWHKN